MFLPVMLKSRPSGLPTSPHEPTERSPGIHCQRSELEKFPFLMSCRYRLETFEAQLAVRASSLPAQQKIISRFSESNSNLAKRFKTILYRAGIIFWPRVFQNLRAICEIEGRSEKPPAYVVADWVAPSAKVHRESHPKIADGHFEKLNADAITTQKSGTAHTPAEKYPVEWSLRKHFSPNKKKARKRCHFRAFE